MTAVLDPVLSYEEFVASKAAVSQEWGRRVAPGEVHPVLKPHQRDIVEWAVRGGRRAIFASFGLGKTLMQLETLRLVTGPDDRALVVCPLGVRQEFTRDARDLLGLETTFVRWSEDAAGPGIYLTNYESVRDGRLDPNLFRAVSLDEASVLRSYGSKTYQRFLTLFDQVPYRFVATATPSPNRYKELIHYAGFLGVMDTGQALTRFFQRDSQKAGNLQLYPHKEAEFYLWLATWAVFAQRPSDLGYSDDGYILPDLDVRWHEVPVDHPEGTHVESNGQAVMLRDASLGVVTQARERRATMEARLAKAAELVAGAPTDHFLLWHDLEDERRALKALIPGVVDIYGSQDLDVREQRVIDFSDGRFRILAAKPILAGSGTNFQRHCHQAVFCGVGFKFNDFIQSIHRIHRFLQTERVRIDIIYAESEIGVVETLKRKWARHDELTDRMSEIIRAHGLSDTSVAEALQRSIGVDRIEAVGDRWLVANNDCVAETRDMESESVDLVVTSIPFSNHYEYTPAYEDFGHTDDNRHFWAQMDYLTPELLRVLQPGRIYACHVKDRILFGNVTGAGAPTVSPFHAEAIQHGISHGFDYMGMVTVVTDVVRENNQTYRLGWSENAKDSTKMGFGSPEYVLVFRKPQSDRTRGYADTPVTKDKTVYTRARWQVDAHAFWRSDGDRHYTPEEIIEMPVQMRSRLFTEQTLREVYDYESHIRIGETLDARGALPATFMSLAPGSWHPDVWSDVNRMLTLNTAQSRKAQAMHVCPLQFDIVDRLITRYSNPDELVYDPFGGLFTVPLRAIKLGRRGRAVELNPGYFLDGVKYLEAAEHEASMPTLLDSLETA